MKTSTSLLIGFISCIWLKTGFAVPISANSGVTFYNDMLIAGGGQLPLGLEFISGGPDFSSPIYTELLADDAVEFEDADVLIQGAAPETPSIFSRTKSSTRNAGSEGAFASNNTQLYQVLELELVPDGTSDVSQRGVWGSGQAQASLSSEVFDTLAESNVSSERGFTLSNQNATAITFAIEGVFEIGLFAIADGENSLAETSARLDMFFTSNNALDILFAATSPYINNQTLSGDNAIMSLLRETDVANTGHLSFWGSASASGDGIAGSQQAFGDGNFSYALGITLQPGEEISMLHHVSYSNFASIQQNISQVSEPSIFLLSLFSIGLGLFLHKSQTLIC